MGHRLPVVLSATALVVALLGSTPLGGAAVDAVTAVPPFAKKSGFAANAGAVNGIHASKKPKAGFLVPLARNGKFPASVGQVGPPGQQGPQGIQGIQGIQGVQGPEGPSDAFARKASGPISVGASSTNLASLALGAGKYVLIGRTSLQGSAQIVRCRFSPADSGFDTVETTVSTFEIEAVNQDTVALSASTAVNYTCRAFGAGATAYNVVLTAIKVANLTNQ
jgi:hypothetical protein